MKKSIYIFLSAGVLWGCTGKELTREEAMQIIIKEMDFPRIVDYEVYCGDPDHARKALETKLETEGYLKIQKTQTMMEMGNPWITFTDKSKPFLLPTPEKDSRYNIQRVKIADEELKDITIFETGNDATKTVEYSTVFKNLTPLAPLVNWNLTEPRKHRAEFAKSDKGWVMVQRLK